MDAKTHFEVGKGKRVVQSFAGGRLRLYHNHGLSRPWLRADAREVSAFNRALWAEKKEVEGWNSVREIPGFLECLQEMYDGGYSITDIAVVFGLSTERIRQYFEKFPELTRRRKGSLLRFWSDEHECFMPYTPEEVEGLLDEVHERNLSAVEEGRALKLAERQAYIVDAIRTLVRKLRRQPTLNEVQSKFQPHAPKENGAAYLYGAWLGKRRDPESPSYKETLDEIFFAAGILRQKMTGRT